MKWNFVLFNASQTNKIGQAQVLWITVRPKCPRCVTCGSQRLTGMLQDNVQGVTGLFFIGVGHHDKQKSACSEHEDVRRDKLVHPVCLQRTM